MDYQKPTKSKFVWNVVEQNVPTLWYERSRRHGNINSAAVGTISMTDFSGLLRVEYCVAKRAVDASNPGKLAICANNELLFF